MYLHRQAGVDLVLDKTEIVAIDFQIMSEDVRAVLIQKRCEKGAFKVAGEGLTKEIITVITGQDQHGISLVLIRPGQTGMCLGRPSLRRFYSK